MFLFALAGLLVSEPPATSSPPKTVFNAQEVTALGQAARQACGYSTPQELAPLAVAKRKKALGCMVGATVKQSKSLLPKEIETGATIVSSSEFEGFVVFVVQFAPDHPRASVPKDQSSDYDRLLSNRTCQDKWLGGLIDAGMVDGVQDGTMVVYKLQNRQSENLAIIAVGECFSGK